MPDPMNEQIRAAASRSRGEVVEVGGEQDAGAAMHRLIRRQPDEPEPPAAEEEEPATRPQGDIDQGARGSPIPAEPGMNAHIRAGARAARRQPTTADYDADR